MLSLYGSEACLLDATYNTTCYGLPLFVLSVPTNIGYVMAAVFLLADEQSSSIIKALQILSQRCPGWQPKYVMSDYSEAQISAIEAVFPGMLRDKFHLQCMYSYYQYIHLLFPMQFNLSLNVGGIIKVRRTALACMMNITVPSMSQLSECKLLLFVYALQ